MGCRKHLLLDPNTKQPYAYWGLFAPLSTFRRLGQDAIVYMRMLQECLAVAIISTLIYSWPMANNRRTARAAGMSIWGGGAAIGSAEQLTWEHVICDSASCLCAAPLARGLLWARVSVAPSRSGRMV